jgi:hypothetical protein
LAPRLPLPRPRPLRPRLPLFLGPRFPAVGAEETAGTAGTVGTGRAGMEGAGAEKAANLASLMAALPDLTPHLRRRRRPTPMERPRRRLNCGTRGLERPYLETNTKRQSRDQALARRAHRRRTRGEVAVRKFSMRRTKVPWKRGAARRNPPARRRRRREEGTGWSSSWSTGTVPARSFACVEAAATWEESVAGMEDGTISSTAAMGVDGMERR